MYKKVIFSEAYEEFKSGKEIQVRNKEHLVGTRSFKIVKKEDLNTLNNNGNKEFKKDYVVDRFNDLLSPNKPQFDISWDDILNGEWYVYTK